MENKTTIKIKKVIKSLDFKKIVSEFEILKNLELKKGNLISWSLYLKNYLIKNFNLNIGEINIIEEMNLFI